MGFLGGSAQTQAYQPAVDYFSGTGSTAQFTLSRPVASTAQMVVSVANVIQNPNTYTVNGNVITLGGNAPAGSNNVWVQYITPIVQIGQPGQGTVGDKQVDGSYALWNKSGSDINYTAGNVGVGGAAGLSKVVATNGAGWGHFNYANSLEDGAYPLLGSWNNPSGALATYGWAWYDSSSTGNLVLYRRAGSTTGTKTAEFNRTNGNFGFDSGYGSVATAYGCRAWVNFNGTGTVAIRASGNVSSITDNGTGDYTVNFTNAMPDSNYAVTSCSYNPTWSYLWGITVKSTATGSVNVKSHDYNSQPDSTGVLVAIFR